MRHKYGYGVHCCRYSRSGKVDDAWLMSLGTVLPYLCNPTAPTNTPFDSYPFPSLL